MNSMSVDRSLDGAAAIARGVGRWLSDQRYGVLTELVLATGRRVDIMALGPQGQILILEIKSSLADFRTDQKWPDYLPYCDQFGFAVGPDFPVDVLPPDHGVVIADAYGAELLRPLSQAPLAPARRKALTLRFGLVAAARLNRLADPPV